MKKNISRHIPFVKRPRRYKDIDDAKQGLTGSSLSREREARARFSAQEVADRIKKEGII